MFCIWSCLEAIYLSDHFINSSESKFRHDLSQFLSYEFEKVYDMICIACKSFTQFRILCGNTDRTGIQMAFAHHDTTFNDQCCSCNAPFFCAKQSCNCDITACSQLSV